MLQNARTHTLVSVWRFFFFLFSSIASRFVDLFAYPLCSPCCFLPLSFLYRVVSYRALCCCIDERIQTTNNKNQNNNNKKKDFCLLSHDPKKRSQTEGLTDVRVDRQTLFDRWGPKRILFGGCFNGPPFRGKN